MRNQIKGAAEWRPEWDGDQLARRERIREAYAAEVSVMRAVRKALDLSQVETAKILETTQSNVSKLERGDPSISVLRRMAEAKGGSVKITLTSAEGEELAIAL